MPKDTANHPSAHEPTRWNVLLWGSLLICVLFQDIWAAFRWLEIPASGLLPLLHAGIAMALALVVTGAVVLGKRHIWNNQGRWFLLGYYGVLVVCVGAFFMIPGKDHSSGSPAFWAAMSVLETGLLCIMAYFALTDPDRPH